MSVAPAAPVERALMHPRQRSLFSFVENSSTIRPSSGGWGSVSLPRMGDVPLTSRQTLRISTWTDLAAFA